MQKYAIGLVILCIALFSGGCTTDKDIEYKNIRAAELHQIMQSNKDLVLVDVREPYELTETGFIPGAVNIPMGQIEDSLDQLPKTKELILYCRTGRRSSETASFLTKQGYTNVYNLEEGIMAWPYEKKGFKKIL